MKNLLLFIFLFITLTMNAQTKHNAVFFTENGESFWVILNGVRQNLEPRTNVKVRDLSAPMYKLKVIFEDKAMGTVEKVLYMPEESSEIASIIKKNKKGAYVARFFSSTPIQDTPTAPTQEVIIFQASNNYPADPWGTTTTTTTMSTTTTINDQPDGASIDVNMGGIGIDLDVNINDSYGTMDSEITETTVITSTTTTTSGIPSPVLVEEVILIDDGNCSVPMYQSDFNRAKESIAAKDFSDSKLSMAKQIADSNCLAARQVAAFVKLFEYENDRIEFAKYAYKATADKNNYYLVNDSFEYEHSTDELNEFIKKQ